MDSLKFHETLKTSGLEYFVGVPDSLLGSWLQVATQSRDGGHLQIATQEGEALSCAMGYYLGTGKRALVFLQNSGLGNLINPLMSMAHADVYHIPVLLLIGWRGAPGYKDEPQHGSMGRATEGILQSCQVPYEIIRTVEQLAEYLDRPHQNGVRAILIEPGQLSLPAARAQTQGPLRISYLQALLGLLPARAALFATTGFTSRELWALQKEKPSHPCFYSTGGMGFVSALALGFAQQQRQHLTCVLDGDGALLMHAGNLASIGASRPAAFLHILFRNDLHESTGGQTLAATPDSFAELARSLGYQRTAVVQSLSEFTEILPELMQNPGPVFLEVRIQPGTLDGLPRPEGTPQEWLAKFQAQLS